MTSPWREAYLHAAGHFRTHSKIYAADEEGILGLVIILVLQPTKRLPGLTHSLLWSLSATSTLVSLVCLYADDLQTFHHLDDLVRLLEAQVNENIDRCTPLGSYGAYGAPFKLIRSAYGNTSGMWKEVSREATISCGKLKDLLCLFSSVQSTWQKFTFFTGLEKIVYKSFNSPDRSVSCQNRELLLPHRPPDSTTNQPALLIPTQLPTYLLDITFIP